jgi:hypothetical protein
VVGYQLKGDSRTFVSYSSKDLEFIKKLKEKCPDSWIAYWELEFGDLIIDKIEKEIEESNIFMIILSKNSIESNWVKYELNMAITEYIDRGLEIVCVRIDDSKVPLRLRPFLYIDTPNKLDDAIKQIMGYKSQKDKKGIIIRKSFVDRIG